MCFSEINRVRKDMYSDTVNGLVDKPPLELPEPVGAIVHLQEKLFVPVKEYPDVSANNSSAFCLIIVISGLLCSSKTHHYSISCHRFCNGTNIRVMFAFRVHCVSILTPFLCMRTIWG